MDFLTKLRVASVVATASLAACHQANSSAMNVVPSGTAVDAPTPIDPGRPLSPPQRQWIETTLDGLSLRQRVGQMIMVWMLGDYTNTRDTTFAQVVRWVEQDGIGGISVSLGTPVEVASKLNALQRRARVPLLVSADLEPSLGRLESGLFSHYLLETGGATVFPSQMAIAATARDSDAYDVTHTNWEGVGVEPDVKVEAADAPQEAIPWHWTRAVRAASHASAIRRVANACCERSPRYLSIGAPSRTSTRSVLSAKKPVPRCRSGSRA